ncbi:MAG TPA: ABC transporter ATP-binding protein, partial [Geminicoccaceae bacterium]|nr:ABC transporter ATP-binding protein [Geminicoccaceae bacterium]
KTTLLRMLAGFETPTTGEIFIDGQPMSEVPPHRRPVNMVFQSYAIFPHLNVRDNIAYGLRKQKLPPAKRQEMVDEMLDLIKLPGYGLRRANQLSGGQRQRVALARALVNQPEVLLLDEPLGALDLKLRQQMQGELRALQRRVGITFVFVTHDQAEALGMSDRVAVFNHGRVQQIGTPEEIYEHPATAFVAGFVGASNIVNAVTAERITGRRRAFSLRPERIRVGALGDSAGDWDFGAEGVVLDAQFHGASTRLEVELPRGIVMIAEVPNDGPDRPRARRGEPVHLSWSAEAMQPLRDIPE